MTTEAAAPDATETTSATAQTTTADVSQTPTDAAPQVTPGTEGGLPEGAATDLANAVDPLTGAPLDPSMAAAVDNAETARTLAETLQDWLVVGGPVVWILLGMSVAALSILLIKLWQFYMPAPEGTRAVRRSLALWHQGHTDDAIAQLNTRQTVPSVLLLAMRGKRNEPSYVEKTARVGAEVFGMDYADFAAQTQANFERLFSKATSTAAAA